MALDAHIPAECSLQHCDRKDRCTACDTSGLSPAAKTLVALVSAVGATAATLFLFLRRHSDTVKRHLAVKHAELHERRASLASTAVATWRDLTAGERVRHHYRLHVAMRVRALALRAGHDMVRAAEDGDVIGETPRIVIGFAQVVHHLCK